MKFNVLICSIYLIRLFFLGWLRLEFPGEEQLKQMASSAVLLQKNRKNVVPNRQKCCFCPL